MTLSPLQEQALSVLETYVGRREAYELANDTIKDAVGEVTHEFTHGLHLIDDDLSEALCDLLDTIWGADESGLTSYYLHDCTGPNGRGGSIKCCAEASEWKLRNIAELRAYLEHAQVCKGGMVQEELVS